MYTLYYFDCFIIFDYIPLPTLFLLSTSLPSSHLHSSPLSPLPYPLLHSPPLPSSPLISSILSPPLLSPPPCPPLLSPLLLSPALLPLLLSSPQGHQRKNWKVRLFVLRSEPSFLHYYDPSKVPTSLLHLGSISASILVPKRSSMMEVNAEFRIHLLAFWHQDGRDK